MLENEGFVIVPSVISTEEVSTLIHLLSETAFTDSPGIRQIASRIPEVAQLAGSTMIGDLVFAALGATGRLVRSIYFDKSASVNWKVIWHQDLTIALKKQADVNGYGPWSVKDGLPHVQPPLEVLEQMVSVRLHIDDADERNGALRVIPGSHRYGRLTARDATDKVNGGTPFTCTTRAGDVLLMKPHILHS